MFCGKDNFLIDSWNFSEILTFLSTEAVEDRDVTFNQIKESYVKCPLLMMPKPNLNLTSIFVYAKNALQCSDRQTK